MVHIISFPSLVEREKCAISSHMSESCSHAKEALDMEMGRKSHEISVIVKV